MCTETKRTRQAGELMLLAGDSDRIKMCGGFDEQTYVVYTEEKAKRSLILTTQHLYTAIHLNATRVSCKLEHQCFGHC